MPEFENRPLLDGITEVDGWFRAKKTQSVWVRVLDADETINTLEGPVQARAGDGICRGVAGELWPQSLESVSARYVAADEFDGPWQRYNPRPDNEGVLAARVEHPFQIRTRRGWLSGQAGDYVVKGFADRHTPAPDDVWIVAARLFEAAYERLD